MPEIIQVNPKVLGGMPVIRGTRIPVARILALIGLNYKLSDLKKEYPQLSQLTTTELSEILSFYQQKIDQQ
ncbi:hypothetical protein A2688_01035 [Candidatus Daviesbacteria bacterium RIFCSPHIGHO2_01_FULL_38_8]|nr:MAG: hypothetical protein A2688_01035 [Candidatus Daviesbacteria bacterium RIFCSPHIGHO2_01_FULL_38_8]